MGDRPDPDETPQNRATSEAEGPGCFRSAEEWLAQQGVERRSFRVEPPVRSDEESSTGPGVSPREAMRLAAEPPPTAPGEATSTADGEPEDGDPSDLEEGPQRGLEEQVTGAVAYARRATAQTPMSEQRLRRKLERRGELPVVIRHALERCRAEGIVDDLAYAQALAEEGHRKGHAPLRIRQDLDKRGLPRDVAERVLAAYDGEDREAAAFGVARRKAATMRNVEAEAAFRRLVGHLARRGYPEGLSRKVARQVVYVDREHEQVAGH